MPETLGFCHSKGNGKPTKAAPIATESSQHRQEGKREPLLTGLSEAGRPDFTPFSDEKTGPGRSEDLPPPHSGELGL